MYFVLIAKTVVAGKIYLTQLLKIYTFGPRTGWCRFSSRNCMSERTIILHFIPSGVVFPIYPKNALTET